MVNQSKKDDPRFWKKWKESGATGDINGKTTSEAYAFFDCNASPIQIAQEIPAIKELVRTAKTPKRLELYLTDEALPIISHNSFDYELLHIALDAKNAGIRYVLGARSRPNVTNRQIADELASILNQAYQSPLYKEEEQFRGEVVYKEKGRYLFRE